RLIRLFDGERAATCQRPADPASGLWPARLVDDIHTRTLYLYRSTQRIGKVMAWQSAVSGRSRIMESALERLNLDRLRQLLPDAVAPRFPVTGRLQGEWAAKGRALDHTHPRAWYERECGQIAQQRGVVVTD